MVAPTRITRATDKQVVDLFNKLAESLNFHQITVLQAGVARRSYQKTIDKNDFEERSYFISSVQAVLHNQQSRIVFARGQYRGGGNSIDPNTFQTLRQSAPYDEYWLGGGAFTVEEVTEASRAFSKFRFTDALSDEDENHTVALLASHVEQLRELELSFHQKQLDADDELRRRRIALEEAADERIKLREQDLELERVELEQLRKDINDREPQHERRRLREDLTKSIGTILKGESGNQEKSYRSHWFFMASGVFLITISLMFTLQLSLAPTSAQPSVADATFSFWMTALKGFAAGAAGVAFLWAGLSGLKRAEEAERAQSLRLQRYSHDMDRASWVVETILQLSSTESAKVPDVWLESVCNDLFKTDLEKASATPDSLEALGALLDATARAKKGTQGFEFELERKDAKRLAKQAS